VNRPTASNPPRLPALPRVPAPLRLAGGLARRYPATHPAPTHPTPFAHTARRAFTITEILVVIIIIVLMLALAMPVFRFITGSRSQAGATNVIAAFLGRCRNDAIGLQQNMGAAFYVDTVTSRTVIVEVEPVQPNIAPFDLNYSTAYPSGSYVSYNYGTPAAPTYNYYVAIQAVPPSFANSGQPQNILCTNTTYWTEVSTSAGANSSTSAAFNTFLATLYDKVPGTDFELLPSGVGVQLVNDDSRPTGSNVPASDRYLQLGAVFFDASGRLTYQPFIFFRGGLIGRGAGFANSTYNVAQNQTSSYTPGSNGSTHAVADDPLYSAFGLVVYDRDAWLSQGFPADWIIEGPNSQSAYGTAAGTPTEFGDEAWLDTNGSPLLINRYTGTLLRNE
jgi:type II secretory pathway pseudopilin PulG